MCRIHMRAWARVALFLAVYLTLVGCATATTPAPTTAQTDNSDDRFPPTTHLRDQGEAVSDLSDHANEDDRDPLIPPSLRQRRALLAERGRLRQQGALAGAARLNSVLASEAFLRTARVAARWLDQRDLGTGLFPSHLGPNGRIWTYGDAGADLFPHLSVATRILHRDRFPELLATLAAERSFSPGLPADISLDSRGPVEQEDEKRMLGAVEYAKDGLLPLIELLGPDPWLPRLREVLDAVIAASSTPTPNGLIPASSAEINGSMLQALARAYWATGDRRYVTMGDRIAAAYLEHALPTTEHIPPHRWDFIENEPIGPRRFYLGDHGNEVVAGLVEWHRVEIALGSPQAARHRVAIRKMLDRLLVAGRAPNGLWYELIDVPSARVRDKDLTDNWGYLGQAYLHQAAIERSMPDGDLAAAERYETATRTALRAVADVDFYAWESGEMDGYADTLESAIYLLRYLDVPDAADWVDEQIAVLYGYQQPNGAVTDENIDGNFMRTVLLYALWLTQGARLEPWSDAVSLGAARDGDCLQLHLHAEVAWNGRLSLDSERHHAHLKLEHDYPRLNQWPQWFAVSGARTYAVDGTDSGQMVVPGADLISGIAVSVIPNRGYELRVCPNSDE